MEKKEYIKPEVDVMAIEAETQMMTASQYTQPGFGGNGTEADGDGEVLTNRRRRGEWGNLWAETK